MTENDIENSIIVCGCSDFDATIRPKTVNQVARYTWWNITQQINRSLETTKDTPFKILMQGLERYLDKDVLCYMECAFPSNEAEKRQHIVEPLQFDVPEQRVFYFSLLEAFAAISGEITHTSERDYIIEEKESFIQAFPLFLLATYHDGVYAVDNTYIHTFLLKHFYARHIPFTTVRFVSSNSTRILYPAKEALMYTNATWRLLLIKPHQIVNDCLYCFIKCDFALGVLYRAVQ